MDNFQVFQGDVFIERVAAIPADAKEAQRNGDRVEVAFGEISGHAHVFASKDITTFKSRTVNDPLRGGSFEEMYIKTGGTVINHVDRNNNLTGEHGSLELPAGIYRVVRQRENSPAGWRRVVD